MQRAALRVFMRSEKKGYNAEGLFDGQGILVRAGSRVCPAMDSLRDSLVSMRRTYVDSSGVLSQDLYFQSVSTASNFVCGRSANGWKEWELENGEKLDSYRNRPLEDTRQAPSPQPREERTADANKQRVEKALLHLCEQHSDLNFSSMRQHTSVQWKGREIAEIRYIGGEIRVIVERNESSAILYDELAEQNIAWQKQSHDSYDADGKTSFSASAEKAEDVLRAIIDNAKRADASAQSRREPEPQTQPGAPYDAILKDLMHQVAELQKAVMGQSNPDLTETRCVDTQDRRRRIAFPREDAAELKVRGGTAPLRSLAFSLTVCAEGQAGQVGRYQLCFLNEAYDAVSNAVEVNLRAGEQVDCRFILATRMSTQTRCYLGIRDLRDAPDELLRLIPFKVQIHFDEDFNL